ncbi:hypothetical protein ACQ4PT_039078 [Festuca glaucescens]
MLGSTAAQPKPLLQERKRHSRSDRTIVSNSPSAPWWPWGEEIGVNPSKIHQKELKSEKDLKQIALLCTTAYPWSMDQDLTVIVTKFAGNATALEEASIYATYGSLLKGKTQIPSYTPVHGQPWNFEQSSRNSEHLVFSNPMISSSSGSQVDFFEDPQHIDCTQVPPPSHLQVPLPSHINIQPASIDMQENALNLSQGSGMTYSQMLQNMESMQFSQQGQVSFLYLLTGPMGNENQMFMITARSGYVHNSDEYYAHGDNACSLNDTRGRNAQPDEYTDDQEDSAYKYNDTWVNPPQSGQNSDNSDGGEQECSQPDIPDNREDPNVASTVDLAGEDSDGEVRWKPREKKDIRDLRYNVPLQMTGDCSQLRFNVLSKVCMNVASDGSKSNEKYLFVTQEVKKIAEKLDAMTLAEDKAKELDPKDKSNEQVGDVGYAETEYGYLNDPKVVKSKGRPTTSAKQKLDGRYRTFAEQFLWKQQITCSQKVNLEGSHLNKFCINYISGKKKSTNESSNKAKKTREK